MSNGAFKIVDLRDARIVLVGRFAHITRYELKSSLRDAGAIVDRQVTTATRFVIVGGRTWELQRNGRVSRHLLVAHLLQMRSGQPQILSEADIVPNFPQLVAIANQPGSTPQAKSSSSAHDFGLHNFSEWQQARRLADWLITGISPRQISRALQELGRWCPDVQRNWSTNSLQWDGRRLLLRLPNGQWCDQSGQLLLADVAAGAADAGDPPAILHLPDQRDPFGMAVRYEAEGHDLAAEQIYRELLLTEGPDVDVCFNLANVLVRRGHRRAALERLWLCVELAPRLVEAWYNLGLVAAELGERETAIRAMTQALQLAPEFSAARQTLDYLEHAQTESK